MTNPVAIIRTRTLGEIVVELFPDAAPQSVRSFIHLATAGYFDGLAFWRIERGGLIQSEVPIEFRLPTGRAHAALDC